MKAFAFALLLFALPFGVQGQVSGQVVGEGGQPLPLASLRLLDSARRTVLERLPDSAGRFVITPLPAGKQFLAISHAGYAPYTVALDGDAPAHLGRLALRPAIDTLRAVTVQSRSPLIEASGGTLTYNVSKSVLAGGASAYDALKGAPGVAVESETTITLNGKGGTRVLLDGKSTYLSGRELIDLLRTMPAFQVRSIEITASPSAKYDAAGSGGAINIRLQKSPLKGLSGTATAGVAYGITARQMLDLNFQYKRGRYTLFGGYNHTVGHYTYVYGTDRWQRGRAYNSYTDDTDKRARCGGRIGLDYSLSKKSTAGLLLTSHLVAGGGITRTATGISKAGTTEREQTLTAVNDYYFQQTDRYVLNANYRLEAGKDRVLTADADYGWFAKGNANLQTNAYRDAAETLLRQNDYRSFTDIGISLQALKVDYATPLRTGLLEAGIKLSAVASENGARFLHLLPGRDSLDAGRTNAFAYKEGIRSGYLNYKKTAGALTVQAGLRLETTVSDGRLAYKSAGADTVTQIRRSYTDLFPSVSVSVKPKGAYSVSLSYSRRIDRPAYQDLNPFIYLLDELSFWQGNPFLRPQLTHRGALQGVYRSTTVLTLAYAHTDGYSRRITDTLAGTQIVMILRNLGVQTHLSLSLTHSFRVVKGWEASFTGTAYRLHNRVALDAARHLELRQPAARMNLQQRFTLPRRLAAEVSAYWSSRRLAGANEIARGTSGVDIGLQKGLWKDKGTLRLSVIDVYKGVRSRSEQRFQGFYLSSYGYYESRQVRLNISYRFADAKGPKNRASALESESGRIR